MVEAVHEHGALAGIELCLFGNSTSGQLSRQVGMDLTSTPHRDSPWQTRAMDKSDFAMVRRWHKQAALRSIEAGFDIVYVYATHSFLLHNVLSSVTNQRSDEYGGSLENRVRLVREIIEDTKDAVGDKAAVAVRFSADQGRHVKWRDR